MLVKKNKVEINLFPEFKKKQLKIKKISFQKSEAKPAKIYSKIQLEIEKIAKQL